MDAVVLAEFLMNFGFDLSDTFTSDTKLLSYFFKRMLYTINKSMSKFENLSFLFWKIIKNFFNLISNNSASLRGRKRMTGQSLYYPRVMMRTLAQVLTEEYSEHGVHVANVVIDGPIDSPGTRAFPWAQERPDLIMNPVKIAEAFFYLHTQDRSCWTHELQ